jgi:hypothetical protein
MPSGSTKVTSFVSRRGILAATSEVPTEPATRTMSDHRDWRTTLIGGILSGADRTWAALRHLTEQNTPTCQCSPARTP